MSEALRVDYRTLSPYVRFVHEVEMTPGIRLRERHIYDYEFIYIVKGSCTLRIEDRKYSLRGGDLAYIRPHLANEMWVEENAPLHCFAVHFDYMFLGEGMDFSAPAVYMEKSEEEGRKSGGSWLRERPTTELAELEIAEKMSVKRVQPFYEAFRQLCLHYDRHAPDSGLWLKSWMLQLIGLIHQEQMTEEGIRVGHPHVDLVLDAIAYMEKHYEERITAAALARRASLTPKYFGTIFKDATGRTISEHLLQLRMEQAKIWLGQRSLTVREVAEKVGIGDLYYFSKLFKRTWGLPPKRYADSVAWLNQQRK